jgi:hypothetical protein
VAARDGGDAGRVVRPVVHDEDGHLAAGATRRVRAQRGEAPVELHGAVAHRDDDRERLDRRGPGPRVRKPAVDEQPREGERGGRVRAAFREVGQHA